MDIEKEKNALNPTEIINPKLFTVIGFSAGLVIWFVDALIDSFIIEPDESFIESLFFADGTELWMRLLVLIILTFIGIYSSVTFRKSLDLNILLHKYQFELEELVLVRTEQLEEKSIELERLANIDPLTELYNRRKFLEICNVELNRFLRHQRPFSILMLDIDDFKNINDSFGHDMGDKVIKTFADLIKNSTRNTDYFARWGGEEFIIMIPESDCIGRCKLAEKIITLLNEYTFDDFDQVTVSIGVTSAKVGDENIDQIIKRADLALYKAKENGKNQYQIVD